MTISSLKDYVTQTSRNHFTLFSTHDDVIHQRCPQKPPEAITFKGRYEYILPDGCEASTTSHTLYTAFDSIFHISQELVFRRIDFSVFFDSGLKSFEDALHLIKQHLDSIRHESIPEISLDKAKELLQKAEDENKTLYWFTSRKWTILFVCAGFTTTITVLVCIACTYKQFRRNIRGRRLRRAMRAPPPNEQQQGYAMVPLGR